MPVSLFYRPTLPFNNPLYSSSSLQTKNPTNMGLDVVIRVELYQQYHPKIALECVCGKFRYPTPLVLRVDGLHLVETDRSDK